MQRSRGFTLLEILVVLMLITAIFASVSFSVQKDTWMVMQDESEEFRDMLTDLSDHASFRQTGFGLYITKAGYWWVERVEVSQDLDSLQTIYAWLPIQSERFINKEFEDIYLFELNIDDSPVTLLDTFPEIDLESEDFLEELEELEDGEIVTGVFNSDGSIDDVEIGVTPHIYIDLNGELSNAFTLAMIEEVEEIEQEPIIYHVQSDGFNRAQVLRYIEGDF